MQVANSQDLVREIQATDPHSFAHPDEAVVRHLDLDITVDFDRKIISGKATCEIENRKNVNRIILDTRDLKIEKVTLDNGEPATFTLGDEVKFLGRALTVNLKPASAEASAGRHYPIYCELSSRNL